MVKLPSSSVAFLLTADGRRIPQGRTVRPRRQGDEFYTVKIKGPHASDAMLEPWEIHGETKPFRRFFNWIRGCSDMNQPRRERGGRRYAIPLGG